MSSAVVAKHVHLVASAKQKAMRSAGTAMLTYFIFEGVLTSFIERDFIHFSAFSGGAGGSESKRGRKAATQTTDANNPYSTGVKLDESKGIRGGPLPTGSYAISPPSIHGHLGLSAKLTYSVAFKHRDGGFYIHGQGPKGNDGCIVIPDGHFASFMEQLKKSQGGHLQVMQAMESAFA